MTFLACAWVNKRLYFENNIHLNIKRSGFKNDTIGVKYSHAHSRYPTPCSD
jgi:hypothetical protein